MSLYHETAEILNAPAKFNGSLKSRIFGQKDLKSQPSQIYALAVESCKWSSVLKEIIGNAELLRLERKITPILSLLLVHDLLLAKAGIALPANHGLRAAAERHKVRLQSELTRARIRRKLSTLEALKAYVENGLEDGSEISDSSYPRWIRINRVKTTLEDQLETTFSGFEQVTSVSLARQKGHKRLYIDCSIPNLVAISPNIDLSKSNAYKSGSIIFQDKASCFPAYLLDPLPEDGDIIDTCAAPGNKTTHIASILLSHSLEPDECNQKIHAFEKNKGRAETLEKMVKLAGSQTLVKIHPGEDFLKVDPNSPAYKDVGALLLDPSCSGSGIVGRDEMPVLHLPVLKTGLQKASKGLPKNAKDSAASKGSAKRKREEEDLHEVMVDDDGVITAVGTDDELNARLTSLSAFQLDLLLHAFKFPSARKITYSTCSDHAEENEMVVRNALTSDIAKRRGWRILERNRQIRGMREWPVRGSLDACEQDRTLADACIRTNKGDTHGTMGFFVAGFVREDKQAEEDLDAHFQRDVEGHLVRDMMGFPMRKAQKAPKGEQSTEAEAAMSLEYDEEEWNGWVRGR